MYWPHTFYFSAMFPVVDRILNRERSAQTQVHELCGQYLCTGQYIWPFSILKCHSTVMWQERSVWAADSYSIRQYYFILRVFIVVQISSLKHSLFQHSVYVYSLFEDAYCYCAHLHIQCYLENSRFYWKIPTENSFSRKIISRWLFMRSVRLFPILLSGRLFSWGVASRLPRFVHGNCKHWKGSRKVKREFFQRDERLRDKPPQPDWR